MIFLSKTEIFFISKIFSKWSIFKNLTSLCLKVGDHSTAQHGSLYLHAKRLITQIREHTEGDAVTEGSAKGGFILPAFFGANIDI